MNILILTHEQRMHYSLEPGFTEVVLPLASINENKIFTYPYQRITMLLNSTENLKTENIKNILHQDIKAICNIAKPNLIINLLTWHHECIPSCILKKIREEFCENLISIFFDHDENNRAMIEDEKLIFESSKLNIFADSPLRVSRIRAKVPTYETWSNTNSAHFLPLPVDPTVFRVVKNPYTRIGLMGSQEGERINITRLLLEKKQDVFIGGSLINKDAYLPLPIYAQELANSLGNIVTTTQKSRSQIKGRSFQIITTGTCLIEQENEDNKKYLDEEFVWFWKTTEDLMDCIENIKVQPLKSLEKARAYREVIQKKIKPQNWLNEVTRLLN